MQCPKCKKEIPDNSLKCEYCGTKTGSLCKNCGAYNLITAQTCTSCGLQLLRMCSECGAANMPDATSCRKCGIEFLSKEDEQEFHQPIYFAEMNSQQKIKALLKEGIDNPDKKIITINGESGCGKNLVLRYTINEIKNSNLIWLPGYCSQISQLSPFGYFQDLLLTFFNINNFCPDTLQLKKNSIKFFKNDFPTLTNSEIIDLLNLLYPESTDKYENIYYNKVKTFTILKKIISTIAQKMKIIFIIDNFEYIDGMSYDFLKELIEDDYIFDKSKIIILNSQIKPGMGLITSPKLTEENYLDLTIAPFTPAQVEIYLKQFSEFDFGSDFINLAAKISGGNPAVLEQIILLQKDLKDNREKNTYFNSVEDIISTRLELLKKENYRAYKALSAMSVLGSKFCPAVLEHFDNNSDRDFEDIINTLSAKGFITQINNLSFEFRGNNIRKYIVSIVKNDSLFEEILNRLYDILSAYKQSSIALLGYIVQKLNNHNQSFVIWTNLMKQAAYAGDIGLYIIAQKQCLKLIENKTDDFSTKVKKNIYTRVGKLLEPIDHKSSMEFLQQAVLMLDDNEDPVHIELLGYIASCAMKDGNYCGAMECIDNVINLLPDNMAFEKTLAKTRLIKPLINIGNYGKAVNLIETEILNEIEPVLSKGKDTHVIKASDLFKIWLNIYLNLAEALVFQGNNRSFDIIQTIYEIIKNNNIDDIEYICKTELISALAETIKGDFKASEEILDNLLKNYSLDSMDSFIISRWNLIDILNKFLKRDYNALQSELFNVASYANNINDSFTKNILKTLLAKILKENNQTKKALEILEEQVTYFANEKVATGVLLAWYLISEIKLITNGTQFALDIATKALDVAQGPNITNYYFIALFNKLIGEIYIAKQDFESAKVYIEKSIFIAKKFNLLYILVKNYILCAKLYQELALPKSSSRISYIKNALKMFQNAKNVSIVPTNSSLQKYIKEELNILVSFCKLNGIQLKKN